MKNGKAEFVGIFFSQAGKFLLGDFRQRNGLVIRENPRVQRDPRVSQHTSTAGHSSQSGSSLNC